MATVSAIPAGYPQVSPYLSVEGADAAIDYYKHVFGAVERLRLAGPDGRTGHAELAIGDSVIMLADVFDGMSNPSPITLGGTAVTISVYVENVDELFARAIAAGGTRKRPVEDQFYGDRSGQFVDPFGHLWSVASHIEDVTPEQMAARATTLGEG